MNNPAFYDVASKEQIIYSGCISIPLHVIRNPDTKVCLYEEESLLKAWKISHFWKLKVDESVKKTLNFVQDQKVHFSAQ